MLRIKNSTDFEELSNYEKALILNSIDEEILNLRGVKISTDEINSIYKNRINELETELLKIKTGELKC